MLNERRRSKTDDQALSTGDAKTLLNTLVALRSGDFSTRLPAAWVGLSGKIADTLNDVIETNERLTKELERISRVVGKEGKTGQRASIQLAAGSWRRLIDSVNTLIDDMARPQAEMVRVIGAVADGDLSQTMKLEVEDRPLKGDFLRSGKLVNAMVGQLGSFASEVTRVAREVGTEGKLGGEARVKGVAGIWKELTDGVNSMAGKLTAQVRNIAEVTTAVAKGDLSKKITVDVQGEILELKNTINVMVDQLNSFASEVTRVAREVGTEGKLGGQATVGGVAGTWKDLTDSVNSMARNLTGQVRNIAEVTTAVANGNLSKKITVDVKGEILELKDTINVMVDQLNAFASEVTRVAREVGTEGKLGGQAQVPGVAGTWKDLTDNVNSMAGNLTGQVRNIAEVTTAVANGNLSKKITVDVKGEIRELKNTINVMVDQLNSFASEVTRVAREVGVEGKLGGQAFVPGAYGTWRDLTDNVNQLAANLTNQVRAIAEVSTAVTQGDLTRSITVEASGEVAALKDNINEMIRNLKDTTQKNTEQDWLKSNLARFTGMLQGQRDMTTVANIILSDLAPLVNAQQGVFFVNQPDEDGHPVMRLLGGYAYSNRKGLSNQLAAGEGLVGQCVLEKKPILLNNVPNGYISISSGLGEAPPLSIIVLPVLFEEEVKAVIELASFDVFSEIHMTFLDTLTESIGIVLNTIEANSRTERLLAQSQSLTSELQMQQDELKKTNERLEQQALSLRESEERLRSQREELRNTNEELQEKATLLAQQKSQVETKNREVEEARWAIEEKAEQLALTSRYKSEFLANMSHELRTPLNSMLILSRQLAENGEGTLTPKQVQFAETIHSSGNDLLSLINDILDLTKIESGMMNVETSEILFADICEQMNRSFHQVARDKGLEFNVSRDAAPPYSIFTDQKRLHQILKNLLSNAFKFTEKGRVSLQIRAAAKSGQFTIDSLNEADEVVGFSVADTGIGIPADKQQIIFEAFQQADGTTSRRYGGTGLGLSISREIASLLGGEIKVNSAPGKGSVFTLYLPGVKRPLRMEASEEQAGTVGSRLVTSSARSFNPESLEGAQTAAIDDRANIAPGEPTLLIVEDDARFARALLETAHGKGFKGVVANQGDLALPLARKYKPDAIILDVTLPDQEGWTLLDRLKHDRQTSHMPVHLVSDCEVRGHQRAMGAMTHLQKPLSREELEKAVDRIAAFSQRRLKRLLVVADDETQRLMIIELIGGSDVETTAVGTSREALEALQQQEFDCMVLDLHLPDAPGFELIRRVQVDPRLTDLPVIVYTGKTLTENEEHLLRQAADAMIIKEVHSPERLLAETALSLHRAENDMSEPKRRMIELVMRHDPLLANRKVLVVDDDVRNIFAVSSVLESFEMEVLHAENGRESIKLLNQSPDVDVVLLDIMMPELDGYQTMKAIRSIRGLENLPIIALTAKAMKADRQKCIEAGASDYISKPLDTDQLMSLLRVWLNRRQEAHA